MKNIYKALIGSAIVIAIVGGVYVNRPRIEVTAEATANATSTVIVPTSTRIIVPVTTSTTSTVSRETPQTVIIYQTYQTTTTGSMIDVVKPVATPVVEQPITYVPTPVYTTVYTPMPTVQPVIQPVNEPTVSSAPVVPAVEPEPVEPFFSELPHSWIEERNNGRWIFFQAKWSDGSKGKIVCNGKGQDYVVSGLPTIVEEKNLADQIDGGSLVAPDRYVSCTFSVGDHGGTTVNIVVK